MPGTLFADVAPPSLFLPFVGGIGVAGLFGLSALVAGGFWFSRGTMAAPRARQWFLISTGAVSLGVATFLGVVALLERPYLWVAVAALVFFGVMLLLAAFRSRIAPGAIDTVDEEPPA